MATPTLEELRAKLKQKEEAKGGGNRRQSGPSAFYPFWNIKENESCHLRFLKDADENNTFFWRERVIIKLPFNYDGKEVEVEVPCMHMFGKKCPIIEEIRPWWQDPELKPLASKYYKKESFLFQGLVVKSPFQEEETPENPIRRFMINKQIFNVIKNTIIEGDIEQSPVSEEYGREFVIRSTKQGQYNSYSTSNWSMKERALSEEELEAIEQYGLFNLGDFLPKEPDAEQQEVIMDLFRASLDGEDYDFERWGEYYRPKGVRPPEGFSSTASTSGATSSSAEKPAQTSKPVEEKTETTSEDSGESALAKLKAKRDDLTSNDAEETSEADDSTPTKPQDILAMIRKNKQG